MQAATRINLILSHIALGTECTNLWTDK